MGGIRVNKDNVLSGSSVNILEVIVSVKHLIVFSCVLEHVVVELVSIRYNVSSCLDLESIWLKIIKGESIVRGVSAGQPIFGKVHDFVVFAGLGRIGIVDDCVGGEKGWGFKSGWTGVEELKLGQEESSYD